MINENPDVQVYISGEQLCITCRISELSVLLGGKSQYFRPQSSFTVSVVEVPKLVGSCWSSKWLEGSWNHSNFGGQTFYIAKYQESHVMNRSKH